ncbi:MAG: type II toxin-antitoxin system RatA family toxin [Gammaproteobacteria bacterium]|nr:type II toxin-antitoxin system RatA family toxin [Gammaproteobacteria bacterium]NND61120.1 type II toxin-antitoxin system RatA family toxin [Gammaproteobacteria bacterium]
MADLRRQLQSPHRPEQLYAIVADVDAYPEFLPWLDRVEILGRGDDHLHAALKIARGGAHSEYVTRYGLYPDERVTMELVDGPMHRLDGTWTFTPRGQGSLLALHLNYEFSNPLYAMMFGLAFRAAIDDLIDHVADRAHELHR